MTWEQLGTVANTLSVVGMFIIILISGSKGMWVFRRELDRRDVDIEEVRRREAWWKDMAVGLMTTGGKAVEVAKAAVINNKT